MSHVELHNLLVSLALLLSEASTTQLLMMIRMWYLTDSSFCWCRLVGCKPAPAGSQHWPAIWCLQARLAPLPCC